MGIYVGFPVTCIKTHLKFYIPHPKSWKVSNMSSLLIPAILVLSKHVFVYIHYMIKKTHTHNDLLYIMLQPIPR